MRVAKHLAMSVAAGIAHMECNGIPLPDFVVADLRRCDSHIWDYIESWEETHDVA